MVLLDHRMKLALPPTSWQAVLPKLLDLVVVAAT